MPNQNVVHMRSHVMTSICGQRSIIGENMWLKNISTKPAKIAHKCCKEYKARKNVVRNPYMETANYTITPDEEGAIRQMMLKEFGIIPVGDNKYIINGNRYQLPRLWNNPRNPLTNVWVILSGGLNGEQFKTKFIGSMTDMMMRRIHERKVSEILDKYLL